MLLIHEDTSTHSTEPRLPTSALQKCFHPYISLALTSSNCFLFQRGGCGGFVVVCLGFFALLGFVFFFVCMCVCVCFMGSPSHSAGLQSLSEVSTFLGGGQIIETEMKVACWKDHLFSWVWKETYCCKLQVGPHSAPGIFTVMKITMSLVLTAQNSNGSLHYNSLLLQG